MNVVFDVGNVLVRWSPLLIMRRALANAPDSDEWAHRFFGHELWRQLNRGHLSEGDAQRHYMRALGMTTEQVEAVFHHVKATQDPVPGSHELLLRLHRAGIPLYALTDNVREIVDHLRQRYDFWQYFRGVVVSAEVGCLKPDPAIFQRLLEDHGLIAERTVFIDDVAANVAGARHVGLAAIQFHDAAQCERELAALGLAF